MDFASIKKKQITTWPVPVHSRTPVRAGWDRGRRQVVLVQGGDEAIKQGFVVLYRSIFDVVRDFLPTKPSAAKTSATNTSTRPLIIDDMGMKQLRNEAGRSGLRSSCPYETPRRS